MSAENRRYAYVYIPSRQTVAVRLGLFRPRKVDTWWYAPRTGAYQDRWTHLASGIREFTPPSDDDWVLVVDTSELLQSCETQG